MRCVTIAEGRLAVAERPVREPGPAEVLVRVHGAGLNRADLLQRRGGYPAPPGVPADVPGLEFAGLVEATGAGVADVARGDRVFGVVAGGAQAEYLVVHASHCALVPERLDLVAAGGVPEAFITAHDAMVTQAGVSAGDWMFVPAIGSGVGTTALQLAKALDVSVAGTARTIDKLERCTAMGLDAGIIPPIDDTGVLDADALAWQIIEATGGGVDVVLDLVGGPYLTAAVAAAKPKGRIVCIGTIAGARATVPVVAILAKRLHIMGTVLRPRDVEEKAAATRGFVRDVVPLLAAATVAPVVDARIPLGDAEAAYDLLASDATFGKVILDCR